MTQMKRLRLALAVVGFILLLPLLLPTALVLHAIYLHQLRSAAARFVCTDCGQILGRESLRLADVEWAKRMKKMRIEHPGVRFRVVRAFHAICSRCGKSYRLLEQTRGFEELAESPSNA
jgi:DNA-directed RNA polymerase subunit RPC12/RpoP